MRRSVVASVLMALLTVKAAQARDIYPDPVTDAAYAPPTATTETEALKQRFMDVVSPDATRASSAIRVLLKYGKPEVIPALIAGLRDGAAPRDQYVSALKQLTGISPAPESWYEWAIWQQQREWPVNPAFDAVFSARAKQIDSGYNALLPPATSLRVPTHDLVWDGSFLDQAGVIDRPLMAHTSRAQQITGSDVVIALPAQNGDKAKAWPLKLLAGETIINDVWAGVPVAISYHAICGSVIVFDRRDLESSSGHVGLLRPTGLLHRGRPLLYSREHNGLWNGCTGQALTVKPPLNQLPILPGTTISWTKWAAANPDSLVMIDDRPAARAEAMISRLKAYDNSQKLPWPVAMYDDLYPEKEKFIAVTAPDGTIIGVEPVSNLTARPVMNAQYGNVAVVITTENSHIPSIRVFRRQNQTFERTTNTDVLRDQQGGLWHIHEGGLVGPDRQILERLPSYSAYWYVFQDMVPALARKPVKLALPKRVYGDIIPRPSDKKINILRVNESRPARKTNEEGLEPMPGPLPRVERLRLARQPSIIPPRSAEEKIVQPHEKPPRPDISGNGH